jgi:hypothetical protein
MCEFGGAKPRSAMKVTCGSFGAPYTDHFPSGSRFECEHTCWSIEEMCTVAKDAIESESKIQDELCIQFMDFTVDKSILNFITPAPPKLEFMEDRRDYKFTIPQL